MHWQLLHPAHAHARMHLTSAVLLVLCTCAQAHLLTWCCMRVASVAFLSCAGVAAESC
jgi:hypothetical protein